MKYNPQIHHRRSIRLKGYDYTQTGYYFITICINNSLSLLGRIHNQKLRLSPAGMMVQTIWQELPRFYAGVAVDAFIVMPDHVHGIVQLQPTPAPQNSTGATTGEWPLPNISLSDVVHRFKSLTTARYRQGVYDNKWQPFDRKLWQRNYYEHIIREQSTLHRIREYIANNPLDWEQNIEHHSQYHPKPV